MQPFVIVTLATAIAAVVMYAVHNYLEAETEEMDELCADSNRIAELTDEAMQRYPQETQLAALTRYRMDNARLIETLKENAEKADVIEALKVSLRDQRLLSQEVSRLFYIEINQPNQFNVLTSAQA